MTTAEAADRLGISIRRVQALIASGRIKAVRHGRDWWIDRSALSELHERPKAGRPKQAKK